MVRGWWWPWWISTAFDLGVAGIALVVLMRASRRAVRRVSALVLCAALVAAVFAPVVMKRPADRMQPMERGMP
jgi:sugar phosphate permease